MSEKQRRPHDDITEAVAIEIPRARDGEPELCGALRHRHEKLADECAIGAGMELDHAHGLVEFVNQTPAVGLADNDIESAIAVNIGYFGNGRAETADLIGRLRIQLDGGLRPTSGTSTDDRQDKRQTSHECFIPLCMEGVYPIGPAIFGAHGSGPARQGDKAATLGSRVV